jgi:hypothetical protein
MTLLLPTIGLIVLGLVLTIWTWRAPEHNDWDDDL